LGKTIVVFGEMGSQHLRRRAVLLDVIVVGVEIVLDLHLGREGEVCRQGLGKCRLGDLRGVDALGLCLGVEVAVEGEIDGPLPGRGVEKRFGHAHRLQGSFTRVNHRGGVADSGTNLGKAIGHRCRRRPRKLGLFTSPVSGEVAA
jgi:hypothetical protein